MSASDLNTIFLKAHRERAARASGSLVGLRLEADDDQKAGAPSDVTKTLSSDKGRESGDAASLPSMRRRLHLRRIEEESAGAAVSPKPSGDKPAESQDAPTEGEGEAAEARGTKSAAGEPTEGKPTQAEPTETAEGLATPHAQTRDGKAPDGSVPAGSGDEERDRDAVNGWALSFVRGLTGRSQEPDAGEPDRENSDGGGIIASSAISRPSTTSDHLNAGAPDALDASTDGKVEGGPHNMGGSDKTGDPGNAGAKRAEPLPSAAQDRSPEAKEDDAALWGAVLAQTNPTPRTAQGPAFGRSPSPEQDADTDMSADPAPAAPVPAALDIDIPMGRLADTKAPDRPQAEDRDASNQEPDVRNEKETGPSAGGPPFANTGQGPFHDRSPSKSVPVTEDPLDEVGLPPRVGEGERASPDTAAGFGLDGFRISNLQGADRWDADKPAPGDKTSEQKSPHWSPMNAPVSRPDSKKDSAAPDPDPVAVPAQTPPEPGAGRRAAILDEEDDIPPMPSEDEMGPSGGSFGDEPARPPFMARTPSVPRRPGLDRGDTAHHRFASGDSVGSILRGARMAAGLDLVAVGDALRIRFKHLDALERGEHVGLPGKTYAVGFVRAYAEHLGLDPEDLVRRFKAEMGEPVAVARPVQRTHDLGFPNAREEARLPTGITLTIFVLLIMGGGAGWYYSRSPVPAVNDLVPAPPALSGPEARLLRPPPSVPRGGTPMAAGPELSRGPTAGDGSVVPGPATTLADPQPDGPPTSDLAQGLSVDRDTRPVPSLSAVEPADAAQPDQSAPAPSVSGPSSAVEMASSARLEDTGGPVRLAPGAQRTVSEGTPAPAEVAPQRVEAQTRLTGSAEQARSALLASGRGVPEATDGNIGAAAQQPAPSRADRVEILALRRAWLRIENAAGRVLVEDEMVPGELLRVPSGTGLMLMARDGGAFEMIVGGTPVGKAGRSGEVLRGISLDPAQLKRQARAVRRDR